MEYSWLQLVLPAAAMQRPSLTTTAPTGTSPAAAACRAICSARRIQRLSSAGVAGGWRRGGRIEVIHSLLEFR